MVAIVLYIEGGATLTIGLDKTTEKRLNKKNRIIVFVRCAWIKNASLKDTFLSVCVFVAVSPTQFKMRETAIQHVLYRTIREIEMSCVCSLGASLSLVIPPMFAKAFTQPLAVSPMYILLR